MFEAKLASAALLKKIVEAIKDLVTDAPFDCTENAVCLQAMDSSHVALVSLNLASSLFETYRCDRTINLGMSFANMAKALKCANNEDTCMLRYDEDDKIVFSFEDTKRGKTQEVTVRMMDIDNEHLGIPEQDYSAVVTMPSVDFQKTCRDLAMFSDSIMITVTKAGVEFTGKGETGSTVVNYAPTGTVDDENQEFSFMFERFTLLQSVLLTVNEPVNVNFSIKYMNHFAKATSLSNKVKLSMSNELPIVVEYPIDEDSTSYLRFFLAPKIQEDEDGMNE
uniref:DNA sliding clamp PCNA n=1 Tax=Syphacia muris TaxID=451379 RepID=A0A0N5ACI5_9BILA